MQKYISNPFGFLARITVVAVSVATNTITLNTGLTLRKWEIESVFKVMAGNSVPQTSIVMQT